MNTHKIAKSVNFILIFGSVISGVLALVIICVPIIAPLFLTSYAIPETIENWGGVIIGFYFGSFITQVGNIISPSQEKIKEEK